MNRKENQDSSAKISDEEYNPDDPDTVISEEDISDLDALEGMDQPEDGSLHDDLESLALLDQEDDTTAIEQSELDTESDWEALQAKDSEWHSDIEITESEPEPESEQQEPEIEAPVPISPDSLSSDDWAGFTENRLQCILEAALFAYGKPLSLDKMLELFLDYSVTPSKKCLRYVLQQLTDQYQDRGVRLVLVRSGYRIQTAQDTASYLQNMWDERPNKYSRATLETLALIAYRQPITRGEIEDVRGVSVSSQIIKSMMEREWIRVVGHRDVPGRPALFATTKVFLDYFCLENLNQLPSLTEIRELDDLEPDLGLDEETNQDAAGKEATFNELVEKMRVSDDGDLLQSMDKELADDLAETTAINDSFEALLAAQREELLNAQEAEDTKELNEQIAEESLDNSVAEYQEEPRPLSEEEQIRIIEAKLAEQQALIEQNDKED